MDEMPFPFFKCRGCGWEPKGKYRELSEKFARKYIQIHGNDPALKRKLELARKGMTADDLIWKAPGKNGEEPRVRCKRCNKDMIFPYLECGSCGWVARRELRARARDFANRYMTANPDRIEQLEIIWDEENRRLSRK